MEFIPLLLKIVGAIWVIYILASAKALQLGIFDWPEAKAKAVWCLGLSIGVLAFAVHWIIAVCLFLAAFAAYFWTKKALRKPDRSPRQIGILEDSQERVDRMLGYLTSTHPEIDCHVFASAHEMIDWLKTTPRNLALLSLDHDLELLEVAPGSFVDPGDGRDVARYLAGREPSCPIIIHTSNANAAQSMRFTLESARWKVVRVYPEAAPSWIEQRWVPDVEQLLALGQ